MALEVWSSVHWVLHPEWPPCSADTFGLSTTGNSNPSRLSYSTSRDKTCLSHVIILICLLGDEQRSEKD